MLTMPHEAVPVTDELLKELQDLNDTASRLHVPAPPVLFMNLKLEDESGNAVHNTLYKCNSYTRNFHNLLAAAFLPSLASGTFGAGALSIKNTAGTTKTVTTKTNSSFAASVSKWESTAADATYGIIVGTGTNAESFEDFALQTPIATGTGSGQLSYQATVVGGSGTATYTAGTKKWAQTISRIFNNNSGGSITVNEIALAYVNPIGATEYFVFDRTKLGAGVAVANSYKLTVTYTVEYTMPA
jgi:hypothetical protein